MYPNLLTSMGVLIIIIAFVSIVLGIVMLVVKRGQKSNASKSPRLKIGFSGAIAVVLVIVMMSVNIGSASTYAAITAPDLQQQQSSETPSNPSTQIVMETSSETSIETSIQASASISATATDLGPTPTLTLIPAFTPTPTLTPTPTSTSGPTPIQIEGPSLTITGMYTYYMPNLKWSDVSGATTYNIYRNDSLITTVNNNTYIDGPLQPNVDYVYYVTAITSDGESPPSNRVVFPSPPAKATNLHTSSISSDQITVDWNSIEGACDYSVGIYECTGDYILCVNIYRNLGNINTYTISGLEANTKYKITVQGKNESGFWGDLAEVYAITSDG